ncbi:MAG: PEP-CTERM sorting domain-containing protein [Lentisphaeria bacterium]
MKTFVTLGMGILAVTLLANLATGAIVFQDTFTGTDGTPFDSSKWAVSTTTGSATIQNDQGKLYIPDTGTSWQEIGVSSKTGANFLTPSSPSEAFSLYSGTLESISGPYSEGSFGVANAVKFAYHIGNYYPWDNPYLTLSVMVGNLGSVGTFVINGTTPHDFTIILTPTSYTITLSDVESGNTLTGPHGLTAGTYNGGGTFNLFAKEDSGWNDSSITLDSLKIEVIPEPATLALLALGGLALLRRRRD